MENFSSFPPEEEQHFVVYEERMNKAKRQATLIALVGSLGAGVLLLALIFGYWRELEPIIPPDSPAAAPLLAPGEPPAAAPQPAAPTTPATATEAAAPSATPPPAEGSAPVATPPPAETGAAAPATGTPSAAPAPAPQ